MPKSQSALMAEINSAALGLGSTNRPETECPRMRDAAETYDEYTSDDDTPKQTLLRASDLAVDRANKSAALIIALQAQIEGAKERHASQLSRAAELRMAASKI
jgi:hypothetical protein